MIEPLDIESRVIIGIGSIVVGVHGELHKISIPPPK